MTDKKNEAADSAAEKEMEGVPEHLREGGDEPAANADAAAAQQYFTCL